MNGTLLVTPEKLRETASQFSAKAVQVKALHDDMINKVNNLSSGWIGNASDAYRQKFQSLKKSMDKINSQIMEHVEDLTEMAENYEQEESASMNAAINLPSSNL